MQISFTKSINLYIETQISSHVFDKFIVSLFTLNKIFKGLKLNQ